MNVLLHVVKNTSVICMLFKCIKNYYPEIFTSNQRTDTQPTIFLNNALLNTPASTSY